jgi:glutathione S-transferase
MSELILHHFDLSPFAEKVRLMLGLKDLAWRSVQIPMIMPKPDLTALTGGYRKTPVLQIGAHVYCDTRCIALELESRFPEPTLFPDGSRGLALALSAFSDRSFFEPGAALSMALNQQGLPAAIIEDRKRFFNFMDFDRLEADIPHLATQFRAQAGWVEQQLCDGRAFLLGERPGLVDIHAYFPIWMARAHVPVAGDLLARFSRLSDWEERLRALGSGRPLPMSAAEAHAVARRAPPQAQPEVEGDELGLIAGDAVQVAPDDYGRDPVCGRLVTLKLQEVAIERSHPAVGTVIVHFPRVGYRIERAAASIDT